MKNEKKAEALERSTRALVERGRTLQKAIQDVQAAHAHFAQKTQEAAAEFHRLQGEDRMLSGLAQDLGVNLREHLGLPPAVAPAPAGGPGNGAEASSPGDDEAREEPPSNVRPITPPPA